jgi:integrase
MLSIHTGIRMSEQYSLKWKQIDFERRQLHLPRTKSGDPHDVPLNATALAALAQLRSASDSDFVFPCGVSARLVPRRGRAGGAQGLYLALQPTYLRR